MYFLVDESVVEFDDDNEHQARSLEYIIASNIFLATCCGVFSVCLAVQI
jgi:hypothetical protein